MLKHLASIFDPLGLISHVTFTGRDIYRELCDLKLSRHEQLTKLLRSCIVWCCSSKVQKKSRNISSKEQVLETSIYSKRLQLVAAHMPTNLVEKTRSALQKYPVDRCYAWTDIEWRYVPTQQNPVDIGSRGYKGNKIQQL